jgi:hypothetical protein
MGFVCGAGQQSCTSAQNDCGGMTVSNPPNLGGTRYSFDAAGKLAGVVHWTDFAANNCLETVVGRKCTDVSAFQTHACSATGSAGAAAH